MKSTFRLGHLPILDHLTLGVAQHNEGAYFKNFSLETRCFSNWSSIATALKNYELDGAFVLFPLALELYRQNQDIQLVLLGHREGQVLIVDSSIQTITDLKGKIIRVPDRYSTHYLLLYTALQQAGINIHQDITLQFGYENIRTAADELATKTIDGFMIAEPLGTLAQRQHVGAGLTLSQHILSHHIDCVLVLKKEFIQRQPEACTELIASVVKAGMFINAYPHQAAEIGESFLHWPKDLLLEALTHDRGHIIFWDLLPRIEDCETLQNIAVTKVHLWNEPIDLQEFINPTFAQVAYRDWTIDFRREVKDRGIKRTLPGNNQDAYKQVHAFFGRPIPAVNIQYIDQGKKYPPEVKKIQENLYTVVELVEQVHTHEKRLAIIMNEPSRTHIKGIVFLPITATETNHAVVLQVTPEELRKCIRAIHFGSDKKIDIIHNSSIETVINNRKEPFTLMQNKEDILLILDTKLFHILPILLNHFI